jgi:hypothetical protein
LGIIAFLLGCLTGVSAYAQPAPEPVTRTTVCEIVRHPEQFERKLVQVRAQIWSDGLYVEKYWLNESLADSLQFGQSCGWLPARFTYIPNPLAEIAFGTFIGTVVEEPGTFGKKGRVRFLIERQEDIYGRQVQIGVRSHQIPLLYDQSGRTFFFVPP